jgi:hypothetical protein
MTTTVGSIDKISFDDGQKRDNKGLVFKAKTCSKTCQRQEIQEYQVHLIPTWGVDDALPSSLIDSNVSMK